MIGIASYDSDDGEEAPPAGTGAASPAGQASPPAATPGAADAPITDKASSKAAPKKASSKAAAAVPARKLAALMQEVSAAKSATAAVQIVRRALDSCWDPRWGAEALYQIAKRSTARTRNQWARDDSVLKLADKLKAAAAEVASGKEKVSLDPRTADWLLLSLESLRRMGLQAAQEQKDIVEPFAATLAADARSSVKSLARLLWLAGSLGIGGLDEISAQLRSRSSELEGPQVALLVAAMREKGRRDLALLQKLVGLLKVGGVHRDLSVTDLVEVAEGLHEFGVLEESAIRPLGQEILRRRNELSPDESHRVHTAYSGMKLPLTQVWTQPGASKKREGDQIVTTQAFAPQEGHEKKRRGNHDVERTSPPRVVRDYKMMSY